MHHSSFIKSLRWKTNLFLNPQMGRFSMQLWCHVQNRMFESEMLLSGERGRALFFAAFELYGTPPLPSPPVSVRIDKFQSA